MIQSQLEINKELFKKVIDMTPKDDKEAAQLSKYYNEITKTIVRLHHMLLKSENLN